MPSNVSSNTSVQNTAAASPAPRDTSNSFISGQDFIGFDFEDDDDARGPDEERSRGTDEGSRANTLAGQPAPAAGPSNGPGTLARAQMNRGPQAPAARNNRARSPPALGAGYIQPQNKRRKFEEMQRSDGMNRRERIRSMSRATPWATEVDWNRCRNPAEMLHRELQAFERWISPTRQEHESRQMVIQLIRNAIKSQYYDAEVESFGSQETQLYMPEGDIDLVVISRSMESMDRTQVLRRLAALLRRANLVSDLVVISKAKVPIIKLTCSYGKYKVDISINQVNGVQVAKWVSAWLRKQPSLRPLILAVKLLLNQRGMSEVYQGGLGSYSVICLVISHLQIHPKVQRGEIDPAKNLGVLFLEFLELYGKNFGYDRLGVSVRGQGEYFEKVRRGFYTPAKPYMLAIEDPLEPMNDISRGSYAIQAVQRAFAGAFDILTAALCQRAHVISNPHTDHNGALNGAQNEDEEARAALLRNALVGAPDKDPDSLLGSIFGISDETVRARAKIEALYYSGDLQHKLGRPPPPPEDPLPAVPPPPSGAPPEHAPPPPPVKISSSPRHSDTAKAPRSKAADKREKKRSREAAANVASQPRPPQSRRLDEIGTRGPSTTHGTLRQGTRNAPIVIVDGSSEVSSDFEDRMRNAVDSANRISFGRRDGHPVRSKGIANSSEEDELSVVDEDELAQSQGFTFGSQEEARRRTVRAENSSGLGQRPKPAAHARPAARKGGEEEQESRYTQRHERSGRRGQEASRSDREMYVGTRSESESDDSDSPQAAGQAHAAPQKGISIAGTAPGALPPPPPAATAQISSATDDGDRKAHVQARAAQRKQVADYWAAKASASNAVSEESEEGEVHE